MPTLSFRFAEPADVTAVVALVESAYRGELSLTGWTSEAELIGGQRTDEAMIAELLRTAAVLLCLDGADLQACCELRRPDAPGGAAYFGMFAVRPELQAAGLGRLVLTEAERIAADEFGAGAMELTVIRQRDRLIAWYERRGYVRTGETRPFPYGDERFGTPKRPDLEFVTLAKVLSSPA